MRQMPHPGGVWIGVFQRLANQGRVVSNEIPVFLSKHPLNTWSANQSKAFYNYTYEAMVLMGPCHAVALAATTTHHPRRETEAIRILHDEESMPLGAVIFPLSVALGSRAKMLMLEYTVLGFA
jgi:hypothetical protein